MGDESASAQRDCHNVRLRPNGKSRLFFLPPELVATGTEYERHTDASRDPFHRYLNQGAALFASLTRPTGA